MKCKNCKNKLKNNETFCGKCGSEVIKTTKNSKSKKIIALVCCFAIIMSGTIGGLFFYNKKSKSTLDIDGNYNCFTEGFTDVLVTDEKSAIEAVASVGDALGVKDAEKELKVTSVNQIGQDKFYRIQQYYNDIPVYGKSVVVSADDAGKAMAMTSNFLNIKKDIDTTPSITLEDVYDSIADYLNIPLYFGIRGFDDTGLIIYQLESGKYTLAYDLVVEGKNLIIDAHSAKVLSRIDNYRNAITVCTYDGGSFNGAQISETEYLVGNVDDGLFVFNANYELALDNNMVKYPDKALPMNSTNNYFGDNDNFEPGEYSKAAYLLGKLELISNYFENINSEQNTSAIAVINNADNGRGIDNAFGGFTSLSNVTTYNLPAPHNGNDMVSIYLNYGLCNDLANNLDIIGHEFMHGINHSQGTFTGDENQTIALDEAYADIFGELLEASLSNKDTPDWITLDRNHANPHEYDGVVYPYPASMDDLSKAKTVTDSGKTFYCTTSDEATDFSHFACTIISHCAYLMWNGIDGNEKMKISSDLLAQLWYESLMFLHSDADFSQCRNAVELTARIMAKNEVLTNEQYNCVVKAFECSGIERPAYTNVQTVKNEFNLSVLNYRNTDDIQLKLSIYKWDTIDLFGLNIYNGNSTKVFEEYFTKGNINLQLDDGIYVLYLQDVSTKEKTEPLQVKIIVNGKRSDSTDTVTVHTDFWEIITVILNGDNSETTENIVITNPTTENIFDKNALIDKYGLSSQKEFVSCESAKVKDYPDDVFGIISMVDTDFNNDNVNELLVIRVAEADGESKGKILAEVYKNNNGNLVLSVSQPIYDISFCSAANIYLFYSDVLSEYCIIAESSSSGSYTGVSSWLAEIYTISENSIEHYKKLENVPTVGLFADFIGEFEKINAPFAKYCDDFDNTKENPNYLTLCEVEHVIFGDSGSYMTRNHKLKIVDTTSAENSSAFWTKTPDMQESSGTDISMLTFTLNDDEKSYFVSGCDMSAKGKLNIPETYNGKPVTKIGELAFKECMELTDITIPDSVTTIGDSAFSWCVGLNTIKIPKGVTSIGAEAFYCASLVTIEIPDSVTSIGSNAFYDCPLVSVKLPSNIDCIEPECFRFCGYLTSITIPSSVKSIGNWAFDGCEKLENVYYSGTQSEWNKISIGSDNSCLTNAKINCN